MNLLKTPLKASKDFMGRLFHSAVKAERQRAEIEFSRRVRPALAFSVAEGVLGLFTLCSAASRKSWFSYAMGTMLLCVCCGHAFLDIRDQKVLDLLSEKLS
ncbi:MAG: hypothetical protein IJR54_03035 [Oscillibacter sp.]|nr:hypothetical protein [Oscillibacter sp.]